MLLHELGVLLSKLVKPQLLQIAGHIDGLVVLRVVYGELTSDAAWVHP